MSPSISHVRGYFARRLALVAAIMLAAALVGACGTSTGALNKIQLHTPLQCPPCPMLPPLAKYPLPSPNTYLASLVTGPDGNLWVPEWGSDKIARVTVTGTIMEFQVPTPAAKPLFITTGSDGALWFTEDNTNTISRITTSGVISEFPVAPLAPPPDIQSIASGPDGNLWFTHLTANAIGVMSTAGTLKATYPIPTANSGPGFIIKGPDGNMWFSEGGLPSNCVNNIAKITMSGTITEYAIPTPSCNDPTNSIGGIAVGPDGNIWFTERHTQKVGRLTPAGVFTEFPVSSQTALLLLRIVSGPDGNLWFTAGLNAPPWTSQLEEMNTSGTVLDEWSLIDSWARGITIGPDQAIWFTDEQLNLVGRL